MALAITAGIHLYYLNIPFQLLSTHIKNKFYHSTRNPPTEINFHWQHTPSATPPMKIDFREILLFHLVQNDIYLV
ncbi:hypothetical protein IMSAG025_02421 [Muribaculaceae bacterium]|nr:hypothetical protein IMSAG025_02421 [Muribaculaceae bacterium]